MIKKLLLTLLVVLAVFLVIVAMQPAEFRVARSTTISAPPAVVFAQVNDLHKWQEWSPWAKLDPNSRTTFEGPPAGEGAVFGWAGNDQVGEGKMTIIESRPTERVKFRLDFVKPFAGTNEAEFTFQPQGADTLVTWSMTGRKNFVMKAIGLFMNCDKMIGPEFEKGLAQLNAASKTATNPAP
jgi:uncharacterized protein YndB with AHSA1/START domain